MGGTALSAGGFAGVDPRAASLHLANPQRPILHLVFGGNEEDPRSLPTFPQASPCTSENGQQREKAPQAQGAKSKHLSWRLSQPGLPHPSAQLPGLCLALTLYLAHRAQQQVLPASGSGPGPGQGPVLGASKSHEAGGYRGPHNARSGALVPELPAPGEVSPGIEGALQKERHQGLPEGLGAQTAASEGRTIGPPSAHQPNHLHRNPQATLSAALRAVRIAPAQPRAGLHTWQLGQSTGRVLRARGKLGAL